MLRDHKLFIIKSGCAPQHFLYGTNYYRYGNDYSNDGCEHKAETFICSSDFKDVKKMSINIWQQNFSQCDYE